MVSDPSKLLFYDVWVARDVEGKPLSNTPPYVQHGYSLARLRQGLPFPVSCCWNGLISMRALPFQQGYRFRWAAELQSYSCACTHHARSLPPFLICLQLDCMHAAVICHTSGPGSVTPELPWCMLSMRMRSLISLQE